MSIYFCFLVVNEYVYAAHLSKKSHSAPPPKP